MMTQSGKLSCLQQLRQGRRNILETGKDTVSLATGKPPSVALEPVFAKTGG
ncbi:MAG: hypothetical protein RIT02_2405 [Planctomycetota bacterium]